MRNSERGARRAVEFLNRRSLGFSVFLVLCSTSAWGLLPLVEISDFFSGYWPLFEAFRTLGYLGALFLFGVGCLYLIYIFRVDTTYSSTVFLFMGYGVILSSAVVRDATPFLIGFSSFLLGAGSALSFIMWQRIFSSIPQEAANREIVTGSALSAILYLVVSSFSSALTYGIVLAVCILMNALFLAKCRAGVFEGYTSDLLPFAGDSRGVLSNLVSNCWRYAFCLASIGYVVGVSRIIAQGMSNAFALNTFMAFGMLAAAVSFLALWRIKKRFFPFRAVFIVLFFISLTSFLLLPYFGSEYVVVFAGVSNMSFSVASMLMMIICLQISKTRGLDPIGVFGVFACFVYLGVFAGRIIGSYLGQGDAPQFMAIALLSAYLLSLSGVFINYAKRGSMPFEESVDSKTRGKKGQCRSRVLAEAGAPLVEAGKDDESIASGRPPRLVRNVVVAKDMVPVVCAMMRKAYGLSNRETDVLELILRGRDVARMAEAMFVSENTVRSHCKNLYKKMDVHSRQQVFDLADEFRKGSSVDGENRDEASQGSGAFS